MDNIIIHVHPSLKQFGIYMYPETPFLERIMNYIKWCFSKMDFQQDSYNMLCSLRTLYNTLALAIRTEHYHSLPSPLLILLKACERAEEIISGLDFSKTKCFVDEFDLKDYSRVCMVYLLPQLCCIVYLLHVLLHG